MADISQEIAAFQNAVYGEEVRGSMISLAEKINDVSEDCEDKVDSFEEGFDAAVATANEAATAASTAASSANTARTNANNAASSANTAATAANNAASAASATNDSVTQAEAARVTAESARVTAENARASAETDRRTAESARANAESNRATNESTRQENETTRNSAEVSRVTAEANRAAAETQRVGAESSRVSAESSRATTFRQMQDAFAEMEQQVIPPATTSTLGGIIVGEGLDVDANGTLSFEGGNFETQEHAAATYATITTVNGKANASHTHAATDIASGTLPVARGGTGVTTAAAERERLGLGSSTGALPVANGGTGSTSAADARTALGVYSTSDVDTALAGKAASTHTHGASDITSGVLPIANGGTGADTADDARNNLNVVACDNQGSMNARVGILDSAGQIWDLVANCINSNNSARDGHTIGMLMLNDGISCYDWNGGGSIWKLGAVTTTTTTVSNIISAASGITITSAAYSERNGVATLTIGAKGFSATGSVTVGTVASGKRPTMTLYSTVTSSICPYASLSATGILSTYWTSAPTSTVAYYMTFTYVLA